MALLDEKSRSALCRHVTAADRSKLVHWNMLEEYSKSDLLDRLRERHLPDHRCTERHMRHSESDGSADRVTNGCADTSPNRWANDHPHRCADAFSER